MYQKAKGKYSYMQTLKKESYVEIPSPNIKLLSGLAALIFFGDLEVKKYFKTTYKQNNTAV